MRVVRPAIITQDTLTSNVPETYPAYDPAATYATGDQVIVAGVSLTTVYKSLQDGNIGNTPADHPDWWQDRGASNRWAMFDQYVSSQTTNPENIEVSVVIPTRVDSVALLNTNASTVEVRMTDPEYGVVYDKTFDLVDNMGINDWYRYFYEPIQRVNDLILTDLPLAPNSTIDISMSAPGNTVACGTCIIGQQKELGDTQYGAQVGIEDYSIKTRDPWGNFTIQERAFSDTGNFTIYLPNQQTDSLKAFLESVRATPMLWLGTDDYESTTIYGFYKNFSITLRYVRMSVCTLEIEGLT